MAEATPVAMVTFFWSGFTMRSIACIPAFPLLFAAWLVIMATTALLYVVYRVAKWARRRTMDKLEAVARAIYDAPDSQSGDYVGTVIFNSEHLFVEVNDGESEVEATKRTAMQVCRDAARAALSAIPDERAAGIREGLEMAAKACEAQQQIFGSTQYATGQPWSSFDERFACGKCAEEIRALKDSHPTPDAV